MFAVNGLHLYEQATCRTLIVIVGFRMLPP